MSPPTEQANTVAADLPFSCDLVMKGGITSGVVYPAAIAELARDHRFFNIGGSSAGAIAAVVTAAAEHGRQTGHDGFDQLAKIPTDLAKTDPATNQTLLQQLFVPQPATRELFDLLWQQRSKKGGSLTKRFRSVVPALLRHSPRIPDTTVAKAGAFGVPLAGAIWLAAAPAAATLGVAGMAAVTGGVTYLTSRSISGAQNLFDDAKAQISQNMHGLCNGASVEDRIGLTEWLHDRIEKVAGPERQPVPGTKTPTAPLPLTYGDLRRQDIGLVTLTTNLSQNSSESFPFADETWAFRTSDVEQLFPPPVASYLIERGEAATENSSKRNQLRDQRLLKLPPPDELPVLLGARISLSFPLMLSAIPLWRLAPQRQPNGKWETVYQQVWLSDGGICSNLPVHLFDTPLPSRPTYGINLSSGATNPDGDEMEHAHQNVWRPSRAGSGSATPITNIDTTIKFFGELLNTMQNWSDNSISKALGVRDRICTIRLGQGEGGMNLDMTAETISGLTPRGLAAGQNLAWMVRGDAPEHAIASDDTDPSTQMQWTRHRWTRLRAAALASAGYIDEIDRGWNSPPVPQAGPLASNYRYPELATGAHALKYLPYSTGWTSDAGIQLADTVNKLTEVDFGVANTQSSPPRRRLVLDTRPTPATELDE